MWCSYLLMLKLACVPEAGPGLDLLETMEYYLEGGLEILRGQYQQCHQYSGQVAVGVTQVMRTLNVKLTVK